MIQNYLYQINHNRYLKMVYKNPYQSTTFEKIAIYIRFTIQLQTKFLILCSFFLFKTKLFKSGMYIIINKKNKQILGLKFVFTKQLLINFLITFLVNAVEQPEIQNNLTLTSFDSQANFRFTILNLNCYFFERTLCNKYYKKALENCNFHITINFKNNKNLYDHIMLLNFFKFYFN